MPRYRDKKTGREVILETGMMVLTGPRGIIGKSINFFQSAGRWIKCLFTDDEYTPALFNHVGRVIMWSDVPWILEAEAGGIRIVPLVRYLENKQRVCIRRHKTASPCHKTFFRIAARDIGKVGYDYGNLFSLAWRVPLRCTPTAEEANFLADNEAICSEYYSGADIEAYSIDPVPQGGSRFTTPDDLYRTTVYETLTENLIEVRN